LKNLVAAVAAVGFLLTACAPNSKQLKEAIEKDPSIVFAAIEKDPEKFIEVVNKAARDAQGKGAEKAAQEEASKRDEEFKNPLQATIEEGRAIHGPASAPITIVEYSDFECPYCTRGYQTMKEVEKAYGDKVRVVFKHLPLDFHPKAMPAAKYFEAVARQSHEKAYKYHDLIFENQNELRSKGEAFMKESAKKAGADMKKLEKDLTDPKLMDRINADMEEAKKFGFSGTPGFLINGVSLRGAYPFSEFKTIIDRHLSDKK
jgi:protein-disulfide isomerase